MEAHLPLLVVALALFLAAHAVACRFVPQVRAELDRLRCDDSVRTKLPWLMSASVLGLIVGLWVPAVGVATCLALAVYFVIALSFHQRIEDSVLRYLPAALMLLWVVVTMLASYVPAL